VAAGRSNQAIAAELVITIDTVKRHVTHILGKLGAANRTEAVARARALGLIPLPPEPFWWLGAVVPPACRGRYHRSCHFPVTPASPPAS
jgi:Bacterial regulatory proteins, luxR family